MWGILRLRRPIRLYVQLCTTYRPFCRHVCKNAFIKSTPRFSHKPRGPPLRLAALGAMAMQWTTGTILSAHRAIQPGAGASATLYWRSSGSRASCVQRRPRRAVLRRHSRREVHTSAAASRHALRCGRSRVYSSHLWLTRLRYPNSPPLAALLSLFIANSVVTPTIMRMNPSAAASPWVPPW